MSDQRSVVVVGSDPSVVAEVSDALRSEYLILTAQSEEAASRILAEHRPELVLLDIPDSLAGPSEISAQITAFSALSALPLILLSRHSFGNGLESCLSSVMECVGKPVDPALLRLRLRNCLALKEHSAAARRREETDLLALARQEWEEVFDAVPDLVALIGVDNTILRVNRAMAGNLGAAPKALVGRKCYEVMHGTGTPPANCPYPAAVWGGRLTCEQVAERGEQRVLDVTVAPMHDAHGAVTGCVHVARDITARVQAEEYARAGQEILRILSAADSQREGMMRVVRLLREVAQVDAVGLRLQDDEDFPFFCHEGFSHHFLHKESSLAERESDGGVCRDDCGRIRLECTCGVVLSEATDPEMPCYTRGGSFWTNDSLSMLHISREEDARLNPRNECIHQGFASVALIPIRAKGKTVGLLQLNAYRKGCFTRSEIELLEDIARNIGEALLRKQAEEKLVARKRFLKMVTDQIPGMVAYWTSELRCTFANSAYLEWFGRSPDRMVGLTLRELLGEELFATSEQYVRRVLGGEAQRFQRTLVKANGDTGHIWAHYVPDVVDGHTRGFFVLGSDVTELKRAEEEKDHLEAQLRLAQKMESIGRLAGGVAHDFNNMLSVIIGHAELCLMKTDPLDARREGLMQIRAAAQRSANLTRQLLAFASRQTISPTAVDLNEAVAGMLKMLQRLIGESIRVEWLPGRSLWRVKADPGQVDQLLANLCVNARDAIGKTGTITLRTENRTVDALFCRAHAGVAPGDYVRLEVSDDGCGMDAETMEKIFEPFFTTKELGKGTGLGLSTVFGIVKQHRGCITVQSRCGEGTTFSIYLPRHYQRDSEGDAESTGVAVPVGQETILLVEDEDAILAMTAEMLEAQGYSVLPAGSPEEALRLAAQHSGAVHLLVTDVIMPIMNGKDLADHLLGSDPDMKCLYMSGYTSDVIAEHGVLDKGMNFIQKPFSFEEMAAKVRAALDG